MKVEEPASLAVGMASEIHTGFLLSHPQPEQPPKRGNQKLLRLLQFCTEGIGEVLQIGRSKKNANDRQQFSFQFSPPPLFYLPPFPALSLFLMAVNIKTPVVVENITLMCLRILQKLIKPPAPTSKKNKVASPLAL